jgi:hypothetical protein
MVMAVAAVVVQEQLVRLHLLLLQVAPAALDCNHLLVELQHTMPVAAVVAECQQALQAELAAAVLVEVQVTLELQEL